MGRARRLLRDGGETSFDGVAKDDALETLSLGATLGLVLCPYVAMRLSYRQLVYSNDPESAGHTLEVTAAFLFDASHAEKRTSCSQLAADLRPGRMPSA